MGSLEAEEGELSEDLAGATGLIQTAATSNFGHFKIFGAPYISLILLAKRTSLTNQPTILCYQPINQYSQPTSLNSVEIYLVKPRGTFLILSEY